MRIVQCDKCRALGRETPIRDIRISTQVVEIRGKQYTLCAKCRGLSDKDLWEWAKEQA